MYKMDIFKLMILQVFIITCFLDFNQLIVAAKDKYTDENRPYEFGFNIEGEQHRREKKDENGIIMGEFGFITADGVYHVTVYATDKEGRFKILSMKNIKLGPAPDVTPKPLLELTSPLPPPRPEIKPASQSFPAQRPLEQQYSPSSPRPALITTAKPLPVASCSHCSIPSTTKRPLLQPVLTPDTNLQAPFQNPQNNQFSQGQQFGQPQKQQPGEYSPQVQQPGQYSPQGQQLPQQGQPQGQGQYNPQSQQFSQQGQPQGQGQYNPQSQQFSQQGQPQVQGQYTPLGQRFPQQGQQQSQVRPFSPGQSHLPGQQSPQISKIPDQQSQQNIQVDLAPDGRPPFNQQRPSGLGPTNPIVVSGSIRPADPSSLNKPLGPGERPGPPPGVTEADMLTVLYKFNYTIGFHGHYEEGYTNGFKKGEYYVNNRNGIATKVTYFADDKGYHPKIETVRLSDLETPKEETEKNPEFGLKGYEFSWFYVPKYHYLNQKYKN